jgi:GNAT superfamily N-acetyltransferase
MTWRLSSAEFARLKGEGNRRALRALVDSGEPPGLLAYVGDEPAGWCAVAPRDAYPRLDRSRVLARVDDRAVWSVSCFYVAKPFRRSGLSLALLEAAVAHARTRGARIVEGYPVEPRTGAMPDVFAWTGLASTFRSAGFREVARRSASRPILRRGLRGPAGRGGGRAGRGRKDGPGPGRKEGSRSRGSRDSPRPRKGSAPGR